MGRLNYLWDTNTVIYYFNKSFPLSGEKFIDEILTKEQPFISVITEIELLCWRSATEKDVIILKGFLSDSLVYELDKDIKLKTIEVRKQFKLKLPDAIIAASALIKNRTLITRNTSDFIKIPYLKTIDPFLIN
jgi:predicted nucleic acid-binding protein